MDGETIAYFARNADRYLGDLRKTVLQGTDRPLPLRQLFIPKKSGGWREL